MSKRLFDSRRLWKLQGTWVNVADPKTVEKAVDDFIDSEIRRNVRDAVERIDVKESECPDWHYKNDVKARIAEVKKELGIKED